MSPFAQQLLDRLEHSAVRISTAETSELAAICVASVRKLQHRH